MYRIIEVVQDVAIASNYLTNNTKQMGAILLVGGAVGSYLHRKSSNGKTAVTLAMMVIVGLVLIFN